MKKFFALLTAAVLLCCMSAGAAAEEYLSIQDMQGAVPARWKKTFETKWRDIEVDAEIVVPQVDALPVVLVSGGATEPVLTAEEAGWKRVEFRGAYDLILSNNGTNYPKSVDGVRIEPDYKGTWYSGFDPEDTFVPMHDITLGEIASKAQEKIALLGYNPDNLDWESPLSIQTYHVYAAGTEKDVLPGYMYMRVSPKISGIPVLSHISDTVMGHSTNRRDEFSITAEANVGYDGYADRFTHIFLTPFKVNETLAGDIPLCSFDKVLAAVEEEIDAGHIRKIYEIKLGYVLYNEPGAYFTNGDREAQYYAARYYAKPMWQVNCLYVKSASGSLRDISDYTDDERNSLDYCQLLIDAQTGELVRESTAKDRCEFKGFVSWDEVL